MTAQSSRPTARYRPGKVIAEQESSEDDDQEVEEQPTLQSRPKRSAKPQARPSRSSTQQVVEDDDEDEEGFVTEEEEDEDVPGTTNGMRELKQTRSDNIDGKSHRQSTAVDDGSPKLTAQARIPPAPSLSGSESESGSGSESDDSSASSSSEDQPTRKFQRPTFIKKSQRQLPPSASITTTTSTSLDPASLMTPTPTSPTNRHLETTNALIAERIHRDTLARLAGKKAWDDDDDNLTNLSPDLLVDDTDGLDPAAEHAAWRLRELTRLKRSRLAIIEAERQRTEQLRRQALPQSARDAEDEKFVAEQKSERDATRTSASYLARYHHKGAFFQADDSANSAEPSDPSAQNLLASRNLMSARFEDEIRDKSLLPSYMQVRDMTKLGKKGRTRYTDLRGEDTGVHGRDVKSWRPGDGNREERFRGMGGGAGGPGGGVDERFMSERDLERMGRSGPSGANTTAVGQRAPTKTHRDQEGGGGDRDRYGGRGRERSLSRSRSRSPRHRRRGSPTPSRSSSGASSPGRGRGGTDRARHNDNVEEGSERKRRKVKL